MKTYRMPWLFALCLMTLGLGSCARSSGEFWDDSQTASRHMNRSVKALGGKHGDSQQVASREDFVGRPTQEAFIPLEDNAAYRQLAMGDVSVIDELNSDIALPQAKESPGDPGGSIPGIEAFADPNQDPDLAQIFRNVHFPYNSSLVKGNESLDILHRIADYLETHPNAYLFIEGHCDERGPQAYNLALGTRRANSVRNYLIKEGISLERLFSISYGKEKPIVEGRDEKTWQENRRGQFKLYHKAA